MVMDVPLYCESKVLFTTQVCAIDGAIADLANSAEVLSADMTVLQAALRATYGWSLNVHEN